MPQLSPEENEHLRVAMQAWIDANKDRDRTDLAELVKRAQPSISDILNRKGGASYETAKRFADKIGQDVEVLLGRKAPPRLRLVPDIPGWLRDLQREEGWDEALTGMVLLHFRRIGNRSPKPDEAKRIGNQLRGYSDAHAPVEPVLRTKADRLAYLDDYCQRMHYAPTVPKDVLYEAANTGRELDARALRAEADRIHEGGELEVNTIDDEPAPRARARKPAKRKP